MNLTSGIRPYARCQGSIVGFVLTAASICKLGGRKTQWKLLCQRGAVGLRNAYALHIGRTCNQVVAGERMRVLLARFIFAAVLSSVPHYRRCREMDPSPLESGGAETSNVLMEQSQQAQYNALSGYASFHHQHCLHPVAFSPGLLPGWHWVRAARLH